MPHSLEALDYLDSVVLVTSVVSAVMDYSAVMDSGVVVDSAIMGSEIMDSGMASGMASEMDLGIMDSVVALEMVSVAAMAVCLTKKYFNLM